MNTLNNLPKFTNPPKPPQKHDDQETIYGVADYCQVHEVWFSNLDQLKEYISCISSDRYLKDALQTTIDKGYHLSDGNLWEFIYNPDRYDSGPMTLSVHKTKEGAEKAMQFHKEEVKAKFDDLYNNPDYPVDMIVHMEWDDNQYWDVKPIKIEE